MSSKHTVCEALSPLFFFFFAGLELKPSRHIHDLESELPTTRSKAKTVKILLFFSLSIMLICSDFNDIIKNKIKKPGNQEAKFGSLWGAAVRREQ